jgi:hypothetical protein
MAIGAIPPVKMTGNLPYYSDHIRMFSAMSLVALGNLLYLVKCDDRFRV